MIIGNSFFISMTLYILLIRSFFRFTVSPLVQKVSGATYRRYSSLQAAQDDFDRALAAGSVVVV